MKTFFITLYGYTCRSTPNDQPTSSRSVMSIQADTMKFSSGHLLFYAKENLVRVCAPGHWAFVVESDYEPKNEYQVAS